MLEKLFLAGWVEKRMYQVLPTSDDEHRLASTKEADIEGNQNFSEASLKQKRWWKRCVVSLAVIALLLVVIKAAIAVISPSDTIGDDDNPKATIDDHDDDNENDRRVHAAARVRPVSGKDSSQGDRMKRNINNKASASKARDSNLNDEDDDLPRIPTPLIYNNNNDDDHDEISADDEDDDYETSSVDNSTSSSIGPIIPLRSPESLRSQCPNWSSDFAAKYQEECGYWLDKFASWEQGLIDHKGDESQLETGYWCEGPASCRGWGDRTGGILNAFYKALYNGHKFRIFHGEGLHSLFSPCVFQSRLGDWSASTRTKPRSSSCVHTIAIFCSQWLKIGCGQSTIVTMNTDRTCVPNNFCSELNLQTERKVHVGNAVGCALRAILEPSKLLLHDRKFPFRVGREKPIEMTLSDIQNTMAKYLVISIHFRLGDGLAFFNKAGEVTMDKNDYARPFRCAMTLESHLASLRTQGDPVVVDGRPVMWFLATDSSKVKQAARDAFGDRLLTLDIRPQHVAMAHRKEDETFLNTIAEWYLVGLGDELIVNRIGTDHADFYHGRVSAFPKTSWAYHLKHWAYDAGRCMRYSLPFEGIWNDFNAKSCHTRSEFAKHMRFVNDDALQPHLRVLRERNMTFPEAYVKRGQVVIVPHHGRNQTSDDPL